MLQRMRAATQPHKQLAKPGMALIATGIAFRVPKSIVDKLRKHEDMRVTNNFSERKRLHLCHRESAAWPSVRSTVPSSTQAVWGARCALRPCS